SVIAALEPGRTSWTAVLDAIRLGPGDDETEVTAAQLREVVARLIEAGHWREGDLPVLVVFDAGYDVTRLAWLLADLPVELLGRLRSDRVMLLPVPPRQAGTNGRPRKHGRQLTLSSPAACPDPQITTSTATSRYGTAAAAAWDRVHPRLTHRAAWLDHDGNLPVIEGTLIRLQVDYLPGDRDPKPVWLWWSRTGAAPADVDRCWQSFLRRFDLEHTFRLSSRCAETRQARPGQAARIKEPPPCAPPRRGENDEERTDAQGTTRTSRLNGKLRNSSQRVPPMLRVNRLPGSLAELLEEFRPCFTAPTFTTFAMLAAGLIARPAGRTVCGMLAGAGLGGVWHHSRAHRFFAAAAWSADAVGLVVLRLVTGWLI